VRTFCGQRGGYVGFASLVPDDTSLFVGDAKDASSETASKLDTVFRIMG